MIVQRVAIQGRCLNQTLRPSLLSGGSRTRLTLMEFVSQTSWVSSSDVQPRGQITHSPSQAQR
jgi:hypothetical protein